MFAKPIASGTKPKKFLFQFVFYPAMFQNQPLGTAILRSSTMAQMINRKNAVQMI